MNDNIGYPRGIAVGPDAQIGTISFDGKAGYALFVLAPTWKVLTPAPVPAQYPSAIAIDVGGSCVTADGSPDAKIYWVRDGKVVTLGAT